MQRVFVFLLAVSTVAVAMVPGERQAGVKEDKEIADTTPKSIICDDYTPCAWEMYNPSVRNMHLSIKNSYCICSPDTTCTQTTVDSSTQTAVFYCRITTTDTPSERS